MEIYKNKYLKALLSLLIFFYTSKIIVSYTDIEKIKNNMDLLVTYDFIISFIILILLVLINKDILKKDILKIKEKYKEKIIQFFYRVIESVFVFFVIKILFAIVVSIITTLLGLESAVIENQQIIETMFNSKTYLMIISVSIFAPITEELLFRGVLYEIIKNKKVFVPVSGLIFGLMHITGNIIFILELIIIGIIVTKILEKNKKNKIILSIIATVCILGIFAIIFCLVYGDIYNKIINLDLQELIGSIVYIALGIYLAYLYTKENNIYINILVHGINNGISSIQLLF